MNEKKTSKIMNGKKTSKTNKRLPESIKGIVETSEHEVAIKDTNDLAPAEKIKSQVLNTVAGIFNVPLEASVENTKSGNSAKEEISYVKNGKKQSLTLYNSEVIRSYHIIDTLKKGTRNADLAICYELSYLDRVKAFGDDVKITDFAYNKWYIGKKTTQQYIRIGKMFIEKIVGENGIACYKIKGDLPQSLSKSVLLEFLAYTDEKTLTDFENLYISGLLKSSDTTKKVRDVLKLQFGKAVNDEQKNDNSSDSSDGKALNIENKNVRISKITDVDFIREMLEPLKKVDNMLHSAELVEWNDIEASRLTTIKTSIQLYAEQIKQMITFLDEIK